MNRLPMPISTVAGMIHFDSTTVAGAASELKIYFAPTSRFTSPNGFGLAPEVVKVAQL